jgi:hypothetical protein
MRVATLGLLAVTATLTGCSRGDPELQLTLVEIRALCADIGDKEFSIMNARDSNRPTDIGLQRIEAGKKAECELEYRIKQQEANKPFQRCRKPLN